MITVLSGGVGAGRFLQGLVQVVPQKDVAIVSNTGDDLEVFGLHVSPDIDIVIYHLASNYSDSPLRDESRSFPKAEGFNPQGCFYSLDRHKPCSYEPRRSRSS